MTKAKSLLSRGQTRVDRTGRNKFHVDDRFATAKEDSTLRSPSSLSPEVVGANRSEGG